jgi:hypothetical protein
MIASAPVARPSGKGRQPAAVEAHRDLEIELIAERAEGLAFAHRVLRASSILRAALVVGQLDVIDNTANELGYHATRRIRQIGSVVL